jgi:hypothetical protein
MNPPHSYAIRFTWNIRIDPSEDPPGGLDRYDRNELYSIFIEQDMDLLARLKAQGLPDLKRDYNLKLG